MNFFFFILFYAWRDIKYRKKFTSLFIVNLAVGLFSFLLVDSIKVSFNNYIFNNSREIATADIVIQSRRMMTERETQAIKGLYSPSQLASVSRYFSMGRLTSPNPSNKFSRLIEINAVSDNFPLYGHLELKDFSGKDIPWAEALTILKTSPSAVITKEIKSLFSIQAGDSIRIGNRDYVVKYILEKDVGDRLQISALAYKTYISDKQLEEGVLEEKGTTARFRYYVKVPNQNEGSKGNEETLQTEITKIQKSLSQTKNSPSKSVTNSSDVNSSYFNIRSHNQNTSNLQRIITMVHRYFELITLVTLFLCGVGIFYLFRNFIFSKIKEIAILESLGMKKSQIILSLISQLTILGVAGLSIAIILFYASKPLIPLAFGSVLPKGLSINIQWQSLVATLIIAVLGSLLFTFPIIWAAGKIKIITLIRQSVDPKKLLNMTLWSFVPNVVFFYGLSIWMGGSFVFGSFFSLMFFGSILVVFIIGWGFWGVFSFFKDSSVFVLSFITRNLYQNRSKGFFYFFAIALSVALISLTPQLEYSLNQEIESPEGMSIPTLFIFDLKKENLNNLQKMVDEFNGTLQIPSPMISAEIKTVNGEPFRQFRDDNDNQERNFRPRNQVNLSYRKALSEAETIIKGKLLDHDYNGKWAGVSLESEFAERNGLTIGDEIRFSLINVPFEFTGKVVNLRKVRWNSFQPNFFIVIQDQVLNQVPQKFVTSVEKISFSDKVSLINKINALFPHVSVIDVQEIIREILNLISQFSLLLKLMAGFCFILGLMILFTIINQEIKNQEREINLMKAIGGRFTTLYVLVLGEYTLVGLLAVLSGFVPGIILNYILSTYFFEGTFTFSPVILIQIFFIVMPGIIVINYFGARKVLLDKPIVLLKDN